MMAPQKEDITTERVTQISLKEFSFEYFRYHFTLVVSNSVR